MHTVDNHGTEAAKLADVIRSAAAWWRLAADTLEAGDHDQAGTFAGLGEFGLEAMRDRIAELGTTARPGQLASTTTRGTR